MDKTSKCQNGEIGTFSFIKMHGCGNDYIFFDCFEQEITEPESLSRRLSDRHKGIGGNGVVLIMSSQIADARIRMFNTNGSESGMSGNAIRCVGKYLYESGRIKNQCLKIETLFGIKMLELNITDGIVTSVRVNMGKPCLKPEEIPVELVGDSIIGRKINISGHRLEITCVSMGNPHAVYFHDDIEQFDLSEVGPLVECAKFFPERINFEVAHIVNRNKIRMRVWERGAGETMASGTGACAVVVAAALMGYCDKDTDIQVQLNGGVLTIRYTDDAVFMTGGCEKVFEGTVVI